MRWIIIFIVVKKKSFHKSLFLIFFLTKNTIFLNRNGNLIRLYICTTPVIVKYYLVDRLLFISNSLQRKSNYYNIAPLISPIHNTNSI